jgi:hypothetical protein
MSDRFISPIPNHVRGIIALLGALLCGLLLPATLRAQETQPPAADTGTLVITVKGRYRAIPPDPPLVKPIDAQIQAESGSTLTKSESTDAATGIATFKDMKPETYTLTVTTKETMQQPKVVKDVIVKAGETTTLEIIMDERFDDRAIRASRLILNPEDVSNHVTRVLVPTRKRNPKTDTYFTVPGFDEMMPLNVGNRQNLTDILLSVPGFVRDSINQLHTRGENSLATAYYIDGFQVPPYLGSRASQFFLPDTIDTVTARVAGLPARFGGGSGAIIDMKMREPQDARELDYRLRLGGFNTRELDVSFGNSAPLKPRRRGQPAPPDEKRIRYLFALSQRYTDNALESPQPDEETENNQGASELFYGKLSTELAQGRSISAIFNFSSGRTNIANRTGLGSDFIGFGQGFGFGGFGGFESAPSQADLDQSLRQKDNNSLAMVQFKTKIGTGDATFSLSGSKTTQTVINLGTPNIFGDGSNLPANNSIEYIPAVGMDVDVISLQADLVPAPILNNVHQLRYGGVFQFYNGTDSFQLVPQSLAAANALAALDPRLQLPGDGTVPILIADKKGFYGAAYAEDTFQLRNQMRFNVGFRIDSYNMDVNTRVNGEGPGVSSNNKTEISPRLNIAFQLPERGIFRDPTILRVSYNRLFAIPGLNQNSVLPFAPGSSGGIVAAGVGPQTVDLYDLSVERQFGLNKKAKLTIYSKDIKRTLGMEQHIYGLQVGTQGVYNLGNGVADGAEISFDLLPTPVGSGVLSAFFVYGNSGTAPTNRNQFTNLAQPVVTPFYDFDQQDTITLGASYQMKNGSSAGLSLYNGSGLASSSKKTLFSRVPFSGRDSITEVNLSYNSGPRFLGKRASLELGIENLFNSQGIMNFQAPFAGTRFQQGRRILLGFAGKL